MTKVVAFSMTFKELICKRFQLREEDYVPFMLSKVLYKRTKLLAPMTTIFYPDFLFHEVRLIEKAGGCDSLERVQYQVDFYHHKFVPESVWKEVLNVRASGNKLVALAREVFAGEGAEERVS
jgi:hypothetical protein